MNKYDEYYDYRLASIEDVDNIMKFINDEWRENHILARDKEFFLWQYGRSEYGDYDNINVVLMTDKKNKILGMMGFIPYSNNKDNLQSSSAITKVKSGMAIPLAGIELMRRRFQLVGDHIDFEYGSNPVTIVPILKNVFKRQTGVMQQYYMLNPELSEYHIAKVEQPNYNEYEKNGNELVEYTEFQDIESVYDFEPSYDRMSYKSPQYIKKRFFEHPIYYYKKWKIVSEEGQISGLLFGRELCIGSDKILRLVDFRGDLEELGRLGEALHSVMRQEGYEYIEMMVSDLPKELMAQSGFSLLDPDGNIVIPHYFEPYVRENIKLYYQKSQDIVIFKADGDQDRPNYRP